MSALALGHINLDQINVVFTFKRRSDLPTQGIIWTTLPLGIYIVLRNLHMHSKVNTGRQPRFRRELGRGPGAAVEIVHPSLPYRHQAPAYSKNLCRNKAGWYEDMA